MKFLPIRVLIFVSILAAPSFGQVSRDSLAVLRETARSSEDDPAPWIALGDALFANEERSKAEDAYIKASRYTKNARPHIRLGDLYMVWEGRTRKALTKFRKARRLDPSSMEAQMGVARALIQLRNTEAEDEIYRTIALDSTYASAHLMLAEFYRDTDEPVAMLLAYEDYLKLNPNDVEGHLGLALGYTEQGRYDLVLAVTTQMYKIHRDPRYLAYLGQAMAARGDAEEAVRNFRIYILSLDPKTRALYEDISLVATEKELVEYQVLPESGRRDFLLSFWRKRDLTLTSGGRAREAEHYRRIWYAITHFSDVAKPWDKRGELYIRYGEPDYRSVSYKDNPLPGPAVQAVKRRNADALFNRGTRYDTRLDNMVVLPRKSSVDATSLDRDPRSLRQGGTAARGQTVGWSWEVVVDGQVYLNKPNDVEVGLVGPVFPIPRDSNGNTAVPWESWVYANVGGGIEIVFVDRYISGEWEYAEMPTLYHATLTSQALTFQPAQAVAQVASETPEYFDTPPGIEPLDFYYDVATYDADSSMTETEVYLGIPPDQIEYKSSFSDNIADLTRTIVLADNDLNEIARKSEDLTFSIGGSPEAFVSQASFIPDALDIEVPPGSYRLAVQVTDKVSGRWGVYHQKLDVLDYDTALALSDIHVAWKYDYDGGSDQFRKFDPSAPDEAVWVTPMPTRNFTRKQPIRLYYEVYNLTRDSFGQTRYTVSYRVRQEVHRSAGLFGAVASGFGKLFSGKEPDVVVAYETTGSLVSEPIYFELDGGKLEEGLNEISVTVTDQSSGASVAKKAVFKVSGRSKPKNQFIDSSDQEFDDMMQR